MIVIVIHEEKISPIPPSSTSINGTINRESIAIAIMDEKPETTICNNNQERMLVGWDNEWNKSFSFFINLPPFLIYNIFLKSYGVNIVSIKYI